MMIDNIGMMAAVLRGARDAAGRASRQRQFGRRLCRRPAAADGDLADRADEPARRDASRARRSRSATPAQSPLAILRPTPALRRRRSAQRLRSQPLPPPGQSRRRRSFCSARARSAAIMSMSTTLPRLSALVLDAPLGRRAQYRDRRGRNRSAHWPRRRSRSRRRNRSPSKARRATARCRTTAIARSIRRRRSQRVSGFPLHRRSMPAWRGRNGRNSADAACRPAARAAQDQAQHPEAQGGQGSRRRRHLQAVWRNVFRRAARIRLRRLSLRRPLASGGARHHRPLSGSSRGCAFSMSAAPRAFWSRT